MVSERPLPGTDSLVSLFSLCVDCVGGGYKVWRGGASSMASGKTDGQKCFAFGIFSFIVPPDCIEHPFVPVI